MNTQEQQEQTASAKPESARGCDVYQIVTNRIIELLEQGTVPWHKPWASDDRLPMNLASGKPYRGINVFLLHVAGYGSPYWVTYKQATERGGNVRKSEKSSLAVFWKRWEVKDETKPEGKRFLPLLRYYRVFNVEQCEGIDYPKPEPRTIAFNPITQCERIVA